MLSRPLFFIINNFIVLFFKNLELSSLLKASERSRVEMEGMLKEQNEGKQNFFVT